MTFAGYNEMVYNSDRYKFREPNAFIQEISGCDLNKSFIHESGYTKPIIMKNSEMSGMIVPSREIGYDDLLKKIGEDFELEFIDVNSQQIIQSKLKEVVEKFLELPRSHIINVLSMEISNTEFGKQIEPPMVVSDISLIDNYYVPFISNGNFSSSRLIGDQRNIPDLIPNVTKYCIMSMADSYTDFHIDYGGSSVWYHVLWGEKIFYLLPPKSVYLKSYHRWWSMENSISTFFLDVLRETVASELNLSMEPTEDDKIPTPFIKLLIKTGDTIMLPPGWIHSVHTLKDSLVFGGNFVHDLGVPMQLRIYQLEVELETEKKFLFPEFEQLHWLFAESFITTMESKNLQLQTSKKDVRTLNALFKFLSIWAHDKEHVNEI